MALTQARLSKPVPPTPPLESHNACGNDKGSALAPLSSRAERSVDQWTCGIPRYFLGAQAHTLSGEFSRGPYPSMTTAKKPGWNTGVFTGTQRLRTARNDARSCRRPSYQGHRDLPFCYCSSDDFLFKDDLGHVPGYCWTFRDRVAPRDFARIVERCTQPVTSVSVFMSGQGSCSLATSLESYANLYPSRIGPHGIQILAIVRMLWGRWSSRRNLRRRLGCRHCNRRWSQFGQLCRRFILVPA